MHVLSGDACKCSHAELSRINRSLPGGLLAVQGQAQAFLGLARVAEGGHEGVIVALVVHQVPHIEHALHCVGLARARWALHQQKGQRLRAGGCAGQRRRSKVACCRLQAVIAVYSDRGCSRSICNAALGM